jgi:hypothetical protein
MRRALTSGFVAALLIGPLSVAVAAASGPTMPPWATGPKTPTERVAGPQHWCATNGITCAEPNNNPEDIPGYAQLVKQGVRLAPYIGHDEPMVQFFSSKHGAGNNMTYQIRLPKDPPTTPKQNGSGGIDNFQLHPTFWVGMQLCDDQGSPNPGGVPGHPTIRCSPNSDSNIYASPNKNNSRYFGFGPGQGFMEMQFYPPGWAPWPAGVGCTATQWCSALNIDTFQDNENTGAVNNNACLNTVGPEPVNFAFLTKNGKATAPGNPLHPEHFVPNNSKNFLMNSGDLLSVHLFDTNGGFTVTVNDLTTGTRGLMTASAANGFGSVLWAPKAKRCTIQLHNYHPMYDTASPLERNFNAAHTGNISFSDEIGHFEYCGAVRTDALGTCAKPLGADQNDPDNKGQDPLGDDVFCLPASASLLVKIGGCENIDGDFDSVTYGFNWPGSISNVRADQLLHPSPIQFTSPVSGGQSYSSMAFESNISRSESSDTEFGHLVPCQRHITNPADPNPGTGCVNPPPGAQFYPFYTTTQINGTCYWQQGGPYIPGTTQKFGGSAKAEYGPLRVISYPAAPTGTVTTRYNDFRSNTFANPCTTP